MLSQFYIFMQGLHALYSRKKGKATASERDGGLINLLYETPQAILSGG